MSLDKLVDSTQLDADLTSVASAIRTKGGTSASLAFPSGFVSAIGDIPSGGDPSTDAAFAAYISATESNTPLVLPLVTKIGAAYRFQGANFPSVNLPNATGTLPNYAFASTRTPIFVLPQISWGGNGFRSGGSYLTTLDLGQNFSNLGGHCFNGCSGLKTLILRRTSMVTLTNTSTCTQDSTLASGGSGCTIYIPKSLYDHLGDGTSSDYKAATNWSVVDARGTITWAQIEGSAYDGYYADGTPIPIS